MIEYYTDGAFYKEQSDCRYSLIKVIEDKLIFQFVGKLNISGKADVERAESEAIMRACMDIETNVRITNTGNYIIYTDAQSVIDKIKNRVPNATKNPNIKGIQNIMSEIKSSPFPVSLEIKHLNRRSNKWMCLVDDLVNLKTS